MPLLSVALILAAVGCAVLGAALRTARRERDEALRLLGRGGEPIAVAVRDHVRDTVPRTELQASLFSREAVLEAAPVPLVVLGAEGQVLRANRPAERTFGRAVRVGAPIRELSADLARAARGVVDGPPAHRTEIELEVGEQRTFQLSLRSYPGASGREVVCALVDISADVDYREARRLFSAAVSHELRTPLARILGLAETLALPMDQEERDALVAQTEIEVDNMRRLIDEMLLLAALDRGALQAAEGSADAGAVAEHAVESARERPVARRRAITVHASPGLVVPVSAKLLEVVIGNLVDNALMHAGDEARVDVSVRGLGGEVEIIVRDDGVGISATHLPRVFERFYRGDASRHGPGTGLGLALVKHIVEAHGGRVGVESQPRQGTAVHLVLPEAPVDVHHLDAPARRAV